MQHVRTPYSNTQNSRAPVYDCSGPVNSHFTPLGCFPLQLRTRFISTADWLGIENVICCLGTLINGGCWSSKCGIASSPREMLRVLIKTDTIWQCFMSCKAFLTPKNSAIVAFIHFRCPRVKWDISISAAKIQHSSSRLLLI